MYRIIVMLFTLLAAFSLPASAHHDWSEYDSSKELKLTGTIAESGYEHPHGHIKLATPAAAKIQALVSLLIWIGVLACGRLLAYV